MAEQETPKPPRTLKVPNTKISIPVDNIFTRTLTITHHTRPSGNEFQVPKFSFPIAYVRACGLEDGDQLQLAFLKVVKKKKKVSDEEKVVS